MTANFSFLGVFTPTVLLLSWIIPLMVVLTAAAVLVAFVVEGFSTLFAGSEGRSPAFWDDANLRWGELGQYLNELLDESDPVGDPLSSPAGKPILHL